MVLLIRSNITSNNRLSIFTFQYGSINTSLLITFCLNHQALHSNMVLLIHRLTALQISDCFALHSNMVLLIRWTDRRSTIPKSRFTFQYGSINTRSRIAAIMCRITFTFQYGSINTGRTHSSIHQRCWTLHSNMVLLILVFHKCLSHKHYSTTFCRPCHFLFFRDP